MLDSLGGCPLRALLSFVSVTGPNVLRSRRGEAANGPFGPPEGNVSIRRP
jgi:hypothetical protein